MKSFTVVMPEPPSANRWWRTAVIPAKGKRAASVNTYLSKEAREYKERIGRASAALIIAEGPVALRIDWYRGREAGDLDKRLGVALDAMQGVFYRNDSQVVDIRARRFSDPGNPRLVVTVEAVEPALVLFAESGPDRIGDVVANLVAAAELFRSDNLSPHPPAEWLSLDETIAAGKRVLSAL